MLRALIFDVGAYEFDGGYIFANGVDVTV